MAVSLPTAADVRKVREQAAKTAAERAEVARTPLLAVLGAGDLAVTTVAKAVADARARAATQREEAQQRVADVQHRVADLPNRFKTDEVRKAVTELRTQAEKAYADFAARGEQAWGKIRTQPQVKQAIETLESYTEKFDARVDDLVDDAHDAAEKALGAVTRQSRSTGEKVARTTQRFAATAAEAVTGASQSASKAVADAGAEVAADITEAGDEVAHDARSTARKAAAKTAVRKPATRRTSATNGSKTTS